MKLNLAQFIAFAFVLTWVLGEVAQASYHEKLIGSTLVALITAYINNAHGVIWSYVRRK